MILRYSPRSPFVRKVLVAAIEVGLRERIELTPGNHNQPESDLWPLNPLGKVPTLVLDDGTALFDSRVICEYLDSQHDGRRLFPTEPGRRWPALTRHALGDGIMDAAVSRIFERRRPDGERSAAWDARQRDKVARGVDALERHAEALAGPPDIGHIAAAVALGLLDFQFAGEKWRPGRPALAAWFDAFDQRESMRATVMYDPDA